MIVAPPDFENLLVEGGCTREKAFAVEMVGRASEMLRRTFGLSDFQV